MAGYNMIYCIGGGGGYEGSDGMNPIYFQILVSDGSRQVLEVQYFDEKIKPLGNVQLIIPQEPNAPINLLDACIVFFPEYFKDCPSIRKIAEELQGVERMDFDFGDNVPQMWARLREEALPWFKELYIMEAALKMMDLEEFDLNNGSV